MVELPWKAGSRPLMLAPMQGLTNEALRQAFIDHYRPDVVFTEFVRVHSGSRKRVARGDLTDIATHVADGADVPLIVQLIGNGAEALAQAAEVVQASGCSHLNLNLGCPYGRMATGATGGELLREPVKLAELLQSLRKAVTCDFSIKCRAGYDDPRQLFSLLPLFEDCGADFMILHPRTVVQQYGGLADHKLTAEAVSRTRLPVIANGDIVSAAQGRAILEETGAAGLMIGRGALAQPLIFERIRNGATEVADESGRRRELYRFICDLLPRYLEKFCGERQALMKLKDVLNFIPDPELQRDLGKLKRTTTIAAFNSQLEPRFNL
jgi:tRNA-dihydrouridine synthase